MSERIILDRVWLGGPSSEEITELLAIPKRRDYYCIEVDSIHRTARLQFVSSVGDYSFQFQLYDNNQIKFMKSSRSLSAILKRDERQGEERRVYIHFKSGAEWKEDYAMSNVGGQFTSLEECIKERQAYLNIHSEVGPPPTQ